MRWDGDLQARSAVVSNGCYGLCDQLEHPFMRLKVLSFELRDRYVECLKPEYRGAQYCGQVPMAWPLEFIRPLCVICYDDCGIPIPEGTRQHEDLCPIRCPKGEMGPCFGDCPDAG